MRVVAVAALLLVSLAGLWASTEYVAAALHHPLELGEPWLTIGELRVYAPWGWVAWARTCGPLAPTAFRTAGGMTTLA
ncbi:MAG: hypothetical protein ACRENE_03260, partial [Polyangiaceae bacterium]